MGGKQSIPHSSSLIPHTSEKLSVYHLCELREIHHPNPHWDTGDPGSRSSWAPGQVLSLENQAEGAGLEPHPWHLMPA